VHLFIVFSLTKSDALWEQAQTFLFLWYPQDLEHGLVHNRGSSYTEMKGLFEPHHQYVSFQWVRHCSSLVDTGV
jgi:hypothetical protein